MSGIEKQNRAGFAAGFVCVCVSFLSWFHAQNTTRSVNADLDKNIRLHVPPTSNQNTAPHLSD